MRSFKPDPKKVYAGTKEASDLLKRAFGKNKKASKTDSTSSLKRRAITAIHRFVRDRDKGLPCISCGLYKKLQAGHFYSAGKHEHMRFLLDNINGQCLQCNYYLSGNLLKYRENLIIKIGLERVLALDNLSHIRTSVKADRFLYLEIIKTYGGRKQAAKKGRGSGP